MIHMHKLISGPALIAAGLVMAVLSAPSAAEANEEIILHSFRGGADGAQPTGGLIADAQSNLYGTTFLSGAYDQGIVFKITKGRNRVLHSFGAAGDGAAPTCRLLMDEAGNLYGTTNGGGTSFLGTVFKLAPDKTESVLHSFTGGSDGAGPVSDLIADASGNLYGTTQYGGTGNCTGGCGTVFKVTADGQETVLYSFKGVADGASPINRGGLVADAQGNLYGTTFLGGASRAGTVFKVAPDGTKTTLYTFLGVSDGKQPAGGLTMDEAGNLYGTTQYGFGTIFKLTPDGTKTTLYSFMNGTDGSAPFTNLILDAEGNLYGTTYTGGSNVLGSVYKLAPDGTFTTLYSFVGGNDGFFPGAGLFMDARGNLYGTTVGGGGADAAGTVFEVRN